MVNATASRAQVPASAALLPPKNNKRPLSDEEDIAQQKEKSQALMFRLQTALKVREASKRARSAWRSRRRVCAFDLLTHAYLYYRNASHVRRKSKWIA